MGLVNGFHVIGFQAFRVDPDRPFDLTILERSLFASLFNVSGWIGAVISGTVAKKFGRRWPMILLPIPMSLAFLLVAFAVNPAMMISSRVVQGFCNGMHVAFGQIYISEIAHKSIRGLLLVGGYVFLAFGQLCSFIVGPQVHWRTMAFISTAVPLAFVPLLVLLPLSPVWLVKNGREEEAMKSLSWLRGGHYDCQTELDDIKRHLEEAEERQPSMRAMLKFSYLKSVLIAAVMIVVRLCTGYFVITAFTMMIFQAAGMTTVSPSTATIFVGVVILVCTIVSSLVIDKLGRRRLVISSALVMGLAHAAMGAYFFFKDAVSSIGWLPLVAMMLVVSSFNLGLVNLQTISIAELLPIQIKNQATGLLFATSLLTQSAVVFAYEYMREGLGDHGTFWFYSGSCFLLAALVFAVLPETKGRSLREIEEEVTAAKPAEDADGAAGHQPTTGDGTKQE